jgi:hypothetical protein
VPHAPLVLASLLPVVMLMLDLRTARTPQGCGHRSVRRIVRAERLGRGSGLLKSANQPAQSVIASLTGIVMPIIGATSVFAELHDDLDRIAARSGG